MLKVSIYHNDESRFMPYEHGQQLTAVASYWLPSGDGLTLQTIVDQAFRVFNADLDSLEGSRGSVEGEITFLAACVYRLLRHRSLSVGDVVEVQDGHHRHWLACEPAGCRSIATPSPLAGQPPTAATVYQHLTPPRALPPETSHRQLEAPTPAADQAGPSAAEQTFAALTSRQRERLLREVFHILEYDEERRPGVAWSSDTTQALGDLFAAYGIAFTSPDDDGGGPDATDAGIWSCPGCGTTCDASQADIVVDHVRGCDRWTGPASRPSPGHDERPGRDRVGRGTL